MRPELVERRDRIGQHLFEACEHQIADRMTRKCAVTAEAMLDDRCPQSPLRAVRCQRGQSHSQITRRQDIEFVA